MTVLNVRLVWYCELGSCGWWCGAGAPSCKQCTYWKDGFRRILEIYCQLSECQLLKKFSSLWA